MVISLAIIFFLLIVNNLAEIIPLHFDKTKSKNVNIITLMCYNVKCSGECYDENQTNIANEIFSESPDIVFLCEFNRSVSRQLDSMLIHKGRYRHFYRPGMNSVFYSRYEIIHTEPINTGTSSGKYALNNRICLSIAGDTVSILGCHLSSSRKDYLEGRRKRRQEADIIYNRILSDPYPVIVLGDLNDISGSYTINKLKKTGMKDAWWEKGCGYGATYHNGLLQLRLDHVLYQNDKLQLMDVKVINREWSDHNAVTASFQFK